MLRSFLENLMVGLNIIIKKNGGIILNLLLFLYFYVNFLCY